MPVNKNKKNKKQMANSSDLQRWDCGLIKITFFLSKYNCLTKIKYTILIFVLGFQNYKSQSNLKGNIRDFIE